MRARFNDVTIPLGAKVPTIDMRLVDLTDRKKISGSKKVKFWLGPLAPKFGIEAP